MATRPPAFGRRRSGTARPSTRPATTSASVTPWRNSWICRPSSSHRSCVWQRIGAFAGAALDAAGAAVLAAGGMDRLIDRGDDVGDGDRVGRSRQPIAAARAARRTHQPGAPQLAEQLLQIGLAELLARRDLGQADRSALAAQRLAGGQIDHRHHRVAAAGGELHAPTPPPPGAGASAPRPAAHPRLQLGKLAVHLVEVVQQRIEAVVAGDAVGIEGRGIAAAHRLAVDRPGGDADHGGVVGDVVEHDGVGADPGVVAHLDRSQHLRAGADDHIIANGRVPLAAAGAGDPKGDLMIEVAVVADFRGLADHHAHAVVDHQPPAESGGRVDLDPGQPAARYARKTGPAGTDRAATASATAGAT